MKRDMEYQRYLSDKKGGRMGSRDKELDALAMLDGYAKSVVRTIENF
jgi:hypothetical protein